MTTAYYSTYDNAKRYADSKWKVNEAKVHKITVNVRTNKVRVEPYTGEMCIRDRLQREQKEKVHH